MTIQLRANEEIKKQNLVHWISYIKTGFWALFIILMTLGQFNSGGATPALFLTNIVIGFGPILVVFLKNKNRTYIITNQRLYVEEGVLSKMKVDILFDKINDITVKQKFLQRLMGAGDIIVMTGNDSTTNLTCIESVDQFKELLSACCNKK